tara:strand:- start:637 stop:1041 length:405 start_codon:yes stop_codon:yes gene_type:complete
MGPNGIESAIRMSGQAQAYDDEHFDSNYFPDQVAHDRETLGRAAIPKSRNPEIPKGKPMTDKIDSTDDTRTVNNTMRHQYRVLSDAEKAQMAELKDIGQNFLDACDTIGTSRELSIAKTKMEEAVMWAVKHVTK